MSRWRETYNANGSAGPPSHRLPRQSVRSAIRQVSQVGHLRTDDHCSGSRISRWPFDRPARTAGPDGESRISGRAWPDGTFVDFQHGLNSVSRLREALNDSANTRDLSKQFPAAAIDCWCRSRSTARRPSMRMHRPRPMRPTMPRNRHPARRLARSRGRGRRAVRSHGWERPLQLWRSCALPLCCSFAAPTGQRRCWRAS